MDILLVDDDPEVRAITQAFLEREGYRVAVAANGREALDLLRCSARPRLIVLDLLMPVMGGEEFCRLQRQDPALADIPVIVLSAVSDVSEETAAMGATCCLRKPIELDALLQEIRKLCPSVGPARSQAGGSPGRLPPG